MSAKFKIGDLVFLNEFGRLVVDDNQNRIALIVTNATSMLYSPTHIFDENEEPFCYWAYDIMIGDELITEVPQEFLQKIIENSSGEK